MALRVRQRNELNAVSSRIGEFRYVNYGSGKGAVLVQNPSPVMRPIGLGTDTVCFDETHQGPPYRSGGPLFIRHTIVPMQVRGHVSVIGNSIPPNSTNTVKVLPGDDWRLTYSGGFTNPATGGFGSLGSAEYISSPDSYHSDVNPDDMTDLGNRGWSKLRPTPEVASLGQDVAEMAQTGRMLAGTARSFHTAWDALLTMSNVRQPLRAANEMRPKAVADKFVEIHFGWRPFINSLQGTFDLVSNFRDYSAKQTELNKKWVKRRRSEDEVTSSSLVHEATHATSTFCEPGLYSPNGALNLRGPGLARLRVYREVGSRVWYEGKFRAYWPEFDKGLESGYPALDDARKLVSMAGLRVNPSLLWKITPWSWLVDWGINVGDAIQRFQDMLSDTVAAEYFYVMRHTWVGYRYDISFPLLNGHTQSIQWTRRVEVKRRLPALDAFGFTSPPGGPSGRQLAILGALGMSRLDPD